MQGGRIFTDEELINMGRRNVDVITEAIDAGDLDRAKDLAQRMHRECLAMHDGLISWITALLSFVGHGQGDEAVYQALKKSCNSWLGPLSDAFAHADPGRRAVMLAGI